MCALCLCPFPFPFSAPAPAPLRALHRGSCGWLSPTSSWGRKTLEKQKRHNLSHSSTCRKTLADAKIMRETYRELWISIHKKIYRCVKIYRNIYIYSIESLLLNGVTIFLKSLLLFLPYQQLILSFLFSYKAGNSIYVYIVYI